MKEDKNDFELASVLVPENEKASELLEGSIMVKIISETSKDRVKKQRINRIITTIVTGYSSITLLLIFIVLFPGNPPVFLNINLSGLPLKDISFTPEMLLFYKIFIAVASLSFISFCMYFIQSKHQQSLG